MAGVRTAGSNSVDVVAFLLAFPAVAAAWVGLERPSGAFAGTLAARMSAFVTLVTVLLSVAFYVHAIHLPKGSPDLKIAQASGPWALLLSLAALNAIWVTYAWVRRGILHAAIVNRPDPTIDR